MAEESDVAQGKAAQGKTAQSKTAQSKTDKPVIISGGGDGTVRLWDARQGTEIVVQDTLDGVQCVSLFRDRLIIAAGNTIVMATAREVR